MVRVLNALTTMHFPILFFLLQIDVILLKGDFSLLVIRARNLPSVLLISQEIHFVCLRSSPFTSMGVSSGSSSFLSGDSFLVFFLGGESFSPTHLEMPNRDMDGDKFSALGFRNSLNEERTRDHAMMYYTPLKIEILFLVSLTV